MNIIKITLATLGSILLAFFLASPVASFLGNLTGQYQYTDYFNFILGFPLVYIFLIVFQFQILLEKNKYIWLFIFLSPIIIYQIYLIFNSSSFDVVYLPIISGLLAWFAGWWILKLKPFVLKK